LALVSSGLATGGPNRREEEDGGESGEGSEEERQGSAESGGTTKRHEIYLFKTTQTCRCPRREAVPSWRAGQGPASRCQAAGESWGKAICPFRVGADRDWAPGGTPGVCCRCVQTPSQVAPGCCGPESPDSMVRLDRGGRQALAAGGVRGSTEAVRGRTTWGSWWKCRLLVRASGVTDCGDCCASADRFALGTGPRRLLGKLGTQPGSCCKDGVEESSPVVCLAGSSATHPAQGQRASRRRVRGGQQMDEGSRGCVSSNREPW